MASREAVTAAIESQPPNATVIVSDGSKMIASRPGHGDSAVLLMLESDLIKRVKAGEPFNARPEMTPALRKAARRQQAARVTPWQA